MNARSLLPNSYDQPRRTHTHARQPGNNKAGQKKKDKRRSWPNTNTLPTCRPPAQGQGIPIPRTGGRGWVAGPEGNGRQHVGAAATRKLELAACQHARVSLHRRRRRGCRPRRVACVKNKQRVCRACVSCAPASLRADEVLRTIGTRVPARKAELEGSKRVVCPRRVDAAHT
jgi:hypothetical protein